MKAGWKVKIEDIGPLATVLQSRGAEVKLEVDGEQFWIPKNLVTVVEKEEA